MASQMLSGAPATWFADPTILATQTGDSHGAGHTANVAGGYSHYYRAQDGTIVGTNSAYSPGVDLTPMKEY